jgi:hypothetical protein
LDPYSNPDPKHLCILVPNSDPTKSYGSATLLFYSGLSTRVDEEREEEEVEEEGLEGAEENLERVGGGGEGGYLKEESHYQMMAEGDKVPPDQENSKGNRKSA